MSFDQYPEGSPFEVLAGKSTEAQKFRRRLVGLDGGLKTIFARVTTLGEGTDEVGRATVGVSADGGPSTTIGSVSTSIRNALGAEVARADLTVLPAESNRVSLLRIRPSSNLDGTQIDWALRITNNDTQLRRFTFVVADNSPETKQPWLDIAATEKFDVVAGSGAASHDVQIVNLGTGPLTLDASNVGDLGSGFGIISVPPTVAPYSTAVAKVSFTVGGSTTSSTTVTFISNDPLASTIGGHNRRLQLSAIVREAKWSPGDILVVDHDATDGSSTAGLIRVGTNGTQTLVTVGQLLNTPTGVVIDSLGDALISDSGAFEDGKGGVIRVDRLTGVQTRVSSGGEFESPAGIVVMPDRTIVVVDPIGLGGGGGLIKIDPMTQMQSTFAAPLTFGDAVGVALEPSGSLVVLDLQPPGQASAAVIRVTADGIQTMVHGGTITQDCRGIAVAADGGILVAVANPVGVVRIDPGANQQRLISSGQHLVSPSRLAVESTGSIVVTDLGLHGIIRVSTGGDPTNNQKRLSVDGGLKSPVGVAVVPPLGGG